MKKFSFLAAIAIAMFLQSCGGSKQVANAGYYNNPYPQQQYQQQSIQQQPMQELKTLKVDELVAEETDKLRAVGIANDADEMDARREALQAGQLELASLIETSIVALTQEYNQKNQVNGKKLKDEQRKEFIEFAVSQKISVKAIGTPDRFMLADGSFQIYRCVELKEPTADVLGEIHNQLTREEVIGLDYDREKFIKDNLDRIQELRENSK